MILLDRQNKLELFFMKENLKEFVLFGNFNSIDYAIVNNISIQLKEYDFKLSGFNEIVQTPVPSSEGDALSLQNALPNTILTPQPRPALLAEEGKLRITFGLSRINIDSAIDSIDNIEKFIVLINSVAKHILSTTNITVNRIALNGRISIERSEKDITFFDKLYKKTSIYDTDDEFDFRINSKKISADLGCKINRITTIHKSDFNFKTQQKAIILMYDYNTETNLSRSFSIKDIDAFIKESVEFRKLFIEEFRQ